MPENRRQAVQPNRKVAQKAQGVGLGFDNAEADGGQAVGTAVVVTSAVQSTGENGSLDAASIAVEKGQSSSDGFPERDWMIQEIARLSALCTDLTEEKTALERELVKDERAFLRRRMMHYAEQAQRRLSVIRQLEEQLNEAERLRETWFIPEISRLNRAVHEYESVKREWFEPQLLSREAKIIELERYLERQNSRWSAARARVGQILGPARAGFKNLKQRRPGRGK